MRMLSKWMLSVVFVALLSAPALAQPFPVFRGNDLRQTLGLPFVQKELALDPLPDQTCDPTH